LFRSVESVLSTIREVMDYGCDHFYTCFDPDPNGEYYPRLFRRIREDKLELRFGFECWGLPSMAFVEEFKETFVDGAIILSPHTASEALRDVNTGPISYKNQDLEDRVAFIASKEVACQLFFGYFIPGDTVETVMETQRYARKLESDHCETLLLAFSTDPASSIYLRPDEHDVVVDVQSLQDYLTVLSGERLSPNLMAHRPKSISPKEARNLMLTLNIISFVYKLFPKSIIALGKALGDGDKAIQVVESLGMTFVQNKRIQGMELSVFEIEKEFQKLLRTRPFGLEDGSAELLYETIDYESLPYILMEERFSKISAHYSVYTTEIELYDDALDDFIHGDDTVVEERVFRHDVKQFLADMGNEVFIHPERRVTRMGIAVDRSGKYSTFYVGQEE
jgi:hypothetical protein